MIGEDDDAIRAMKRRACAPAYHGQLDRHRHAVSPPLDDEGQHVSKDRDERPERAQIDPAGREQDVAGRAARTELALLPVELGRSALPSSDGS
jgi:hypothetical protein